MTIRHKTSVFPDPLVGQSLLPFAEADLQLVRLLPAEFSRAIGVSKQTISRWIRDGKITVGADGRLNPVVAVRDVLRNTDPGRFRARLLRQAFSGMVDLRANAMRAHELDQDLYDARQQISGLVNGLEVMNRAMSLAPMILANGIDRIKAATTRQQLVTVFAELLADARADATIGDVDLLLLAPGLRQEGAGEYG